jgi:hypothetical protein
MINAQTPSNISYWLINIINATWAEIDSHFMRVRVGKLFLLEDVVTEGLDSLVNRGVSKTQSFYTERVRQLLSH